MKKVFYLLVITGLIFLFLFYFFNYLEKQKKLARINESLGEKEAILILNYGKGKERWFKGEVQEKMNLLTVFEALNYYENLDFKANSKIVSIEGIENNGKNQWKCYLNGKEIENLKETEIKPKDKIICEYK